MKNHHSRITVVVVIIMAACFRPLQSSPHPAGDGSENPAAQVVHPAATPMDSASLVRLMDSLIVPGLEKYHIPGMVIAVVRDSTVVMAKGYGYADIGRGVRFDPDSTVIRIASVSKLFTATAVLQLAEQGMVDMHRDINGYLSRFKVEDWPSKPITLHHLLTHTAGFDDRYIGKSAWTQEDQIPLGEFLARRLPRRICPPGEVYTYSNFSNALAGYVVEEVAHQDFAAYVRHRILEPLGMLHSDYRLRPDLEPLLARCYSHEGTGYRLTPFDFINDYPGGQMLSTAKDMAKFIIAQLRLGRYDGGRILREESVVAMQTVQFKHRNGLDHGVGYSFGVLPARSQTILMHDGGYTGIGSRLCVCPESRFGFFVACNIMDGALLDVVSRTLLDRIIPEAKPDTTQYPLTTIPQYDREVGDFTGTYRYTRYPHRSFEKTGVLIGMNGSEMTIGTNGEGMIMMNTLHGTPRRMVQTEPCLFRSVDDDYRCAFRRDSSGAVTHLFTNGTTAFEKIGWYETTAFHRGVFAACLIIFLTIAVILPIIRKVRKTRQPAGLGADPVRWFSATAAMMFLLYIGGLGIAMGLLIPKEEIMVGFAHGMHWSVYIAQTIALLAIVALAGLFGTLFWGSLRRQDPTMVRRVKSGGLGLLTASSGVAFVWFLWYWNLIGYQF